MNFLFVRSRNWFVIHESQTLNFYTEQVTFFCYSHLLMTKQKRLLLSEGSYFFLEKTFLPIICGYHTQTDKESKSGMSIFFPDC